MTVRRIKVFGARNTGTNFVESVLRQNLSLEICSGNLPRPLRALYRITYRCLPYGVAFRLVEADRDRRYAQNFETDLGWKHARIPNVPPGRTYPGDVGGIALTRNPCAWLLSLHKRPYQGTVHNPVDRIGFSDFLRAPWRTVGRKHGPPEYSNPVALWNDKVAPYERLKEHMPTMILRYEEVIEDIEGFVRKVAETFGADLPAQIRIPSESTKKDGRSTADIVAFYKARSWASQLSAADIAFINGQLDQQLARRLGYDILPTG